MSRDIKIKDINFVVFWEALEVLKTSVIPQDFPKISEKRSNNCFDNSKFCWSERERSDAKTPADLPITDDGTKGRNKNFKSQRSNQLFGFWDSDGTQLHVTNFIDRVWIPPSCFTHFPAKLHRQTSHENSKLKNGTNLLMWDFYKWEQAARSLPHGRREKFCKNWAKRVVVEFLWERRIVFTATGAEAFLKPVRCFKLFNNASLRPWIA